MLTTLRIKNLALVTDLTLELREGFNVITGETGAGKSIILGALNLLLGGRADRKFIRAGEQSCAVEAIWDVAQWRFPLAAFLERNGLEPCEGNQLVIKRSFTANGSNRQFINGSPTSLNVLSALGESLVDMHGSYEHQSLLHPGRQLAILDAFGNLLAQKESFAQLGRRRAELEAHRAALTVDEKNHASQLDLLRHQAAEIRAARLQSDEEKDWEEAHQRCSNAARILELSQSATDLLNEQDDSLLNQAGALGRILRQLPLLDPKAERWIALHAQAVQVFQELLGELSRQQDQVDLDPDRLREIEDRLNLIHSLKRKYGATVAGILRFGADAEAKLRRLEQRDQELHRVRQELDQIHAELWQVGQSLSEQRRKTIPRLARAATKQLKDLGFKKGHFEVTINTLSSPSELATSPSMQGMDSIEFQFAPNPGEPSRPLRTIASSGEMARVMLALKTVLALQDEVPVLVFDEVDANVGGETARVVGEKMGQIAKRHQVFCVTHLAPVAACSRTHYLVTKQTRHGRTTSTIRLLLHEERVEELARMLGGRSHVAREHAESLLAEGD